jgi:hypothetical protein
MIILILGLLLHTTLSNCQQINLEVINDPQNCVGGQICGIQPSVAVVDRFGAILTNFSGYAYVQMGSIPTGADGLLYIGDCNYTSCGIVVTSQTKYTPIVNGTAVFQVIVN